VASIKRVRRPTSVDVAHLARVSQTTVSHVINNVQTSGISEATRARVLQAIEQLDYHPHEAARNLRSQSSHIIGMAIPEAYNTHLLEIAVGAENYALSKNYGIFLSITNFDPAREQLSLRRLQQQRYDALILISRNKGMLYKDLQGLRAKGYPITVLGFNDTEMDSVSVDTTQGEEELLQHLKALGHRRIGYIYGVAEQTLFGGRLESCLALQQQMGIPVIDRFIQRCGPTANDGYVATQKLLAECDGHEQPSALIVVNDLLAGATLAALYNAGITVPNDMSVASFDNTPNSAFTLPPLTTVDCEAQVIGAEAARLTIERLISPERPPENIYTRSKLIIRSSTGPIVHGR
jgi:DNA-binding LacI/PurR family transcriptional regulator